MQYHAVLSLCANLPTCNFTILLKQNQLKQQLHINFPHKFIQLCISVVTIFSMANFWTLPYIQPYRKQFLWVEWKEATGQIAQCWLRHMCEVSRPCRQQANFFHVYIAGPAGPAGYRLTSHMCYAYGDFYSLAM